MAQDRRSQLYNNLINSGKVSSAEIGSLDQFTNAIKDEATARQFYNNLIGSGKLSSAEIGSEDDFYASLSPDFDGSRDGIATDGTEGTDGYTFTAEELGEQDRKLGGGGDIVATDGTGRGGGIMGSFRKAGDAVRAAAGQAREKAAAARAKQGAVQRVGERGRQVLDDRIQDLAVRNFENLDAEKLHEELSGGEQRMQHLTDNLRKYREQTQMGLGADRLARGDARLNRETGKMERTYITSSGNEYRESDKALAEHEQRELSDAAWRRTHPKEALKRDIDSQIANLDSEMSDISPEWVDADGRVHYRGGSGGMEAMRNLEAARRDLEEARTLLDREEQLKKSSDFLGGIGLPLTSDFFNNWKNFGYAVWDRLSDVGWWQNSLTGGVNDIQKAASYMKIRDKVDSGTPLNDSETALVLAGMAQAQAQQLTDLPMGYTAGQITADMAPFMAQMAANPASGIGRAFARQAVRNFGRSGVKAVSMRVGARVLGNLGEAAVLSNTLQAPRTVANVMQRHTGDSFEYDEDGNLHMGHYDSDGEFVEGGKSLGRSLYEGEVSSVIENFTELGAGGNINKFLRKMATSKAGRAIGLGYLSDLVGKVGSTPFARKMGQFMERTHWNGMLEEPLEEEYGIVLNAVLGTGDNKLSDLWDSKQQAEIFAGTLWFGGVMSAMNTAAYPSYRRKMKRDVAMADYEGRRSFGDVEWESMKASIESLDDDKIADFLYGIKDDDQFSREQKAAMFGYAARLKQYQGANVGGMLMRMEGNLSDGESLVQRAYDEGSDAETGDERKQMFDEAQAAREKLSEYGEQFSLMVQAEDDNPAMLLDYLLSHRDTYGDDQIAAAADYLQKIVRAEGMFDAAADGVDLRVEEANAEVRSNSHAETGKVITVEHGGEQFFVVGGGVDNATDGTGELVLTGTGGAVVAKNAATGEVRVLAPEELVVTSVQDAQQMIEQNEGELRQTLEQEVDDDLAFGDPAHETFMQDDTVTLQDEEGNVTEGVISMMPETADGLYMVQTGDGRVLPLTEEQLNRRIVGHNGQAVERAATMTQQSGQEAAGVEQQTEQETGLGTGQTAAPAATETGEPAGEAAGTVGEEAGATENAMPMIGEGDEAEPDFSKATSERAHGYIYDEAGLTRDEADQFVDANKKEADKTLEKLVGKPPKMGTSIAKYRKERAEWQRDVDAAKARVAYWQDVEQRQKGIVKAEQQAAFEAQQQEAEGRRQLLEEQRTRREKLETAKKIYGDYLDDDMETPHDAQELVALNMPRGLAWDDVERDGHVYRGLQSELGTKRGFGNNGDTTAFNLYLAKKGSGVGVDEAVHSIWESSMNSLPNGEKRFDDMEIKNALLELLSTAQSAADIRDYVINSRVAQAEASRAAEDEAMKDAEMQAWSEFHHLRPEERDVFEELMSQPPSAVEEDILNQIIAEAATLPQQSEQTNNDNEQNGNGPSVGEQPDEGRVLSGIERGEDEIQQAVEASGVGNPETGSAEGAEAGAGEPSAAGDEVDGGAPVESDGVFEEPSVDEQRYRANRQALIDAYTSGDKAAITAAAQSIQQYVDEGLDHGDDATDGIVDIAEDYEGDDPTILADQYIVRAFWSRYLDDDVDPEYIRTGLKASMREETARFEPPFEVNQHGVCTNPNIVEKNGKGYTHYQIKTAPTDKGWVGSYDVSGSTWGDGGPVMALPDGHYFETEKECQAYWAGRVMNAIRMHRDDKSAASLVPSLEVLIKGGETGENLGKTSSADEISSEEAKVDVNPSDGQKEAGSLLDVKEIKELKGAKRSVIRAIEDYAVIAYRHAYDRIPSYQFGASGDSVERMTLEKFVNAFKEIAGVEAKGTEAYMGAVYDHISNKLSGKGNTIALRSQQEPTEKPEETVAKKEHKRIVSDEQMEELRKKLLAKFNNLNAGIDVERMLLGAMYAVGKIERGVTKFADYAAEMVSEIGDAIRPYLKAFYEAVRNMPEAAEYRDQMDSAEVVAAFDVDNFDKGGKAPDVITKAKQVERNRKARQQVKKIEKEVKKQVERGVRQLDLFSDEVAITSQQTGQAKEAKGKTAWWRDENRPAGLDPKDYRTYTSDEAKAYFAGFRSDDGKVDFTKWAHPNLAYITAAAWDGAVIPVEELMQIAEIQEAEQRVKEKDALPGFHIKKNERHELRDRLLDAEHGSAVFENGKIKKVDGKEVFTGPVRQEKKAFIVVGRPAGGKSSVFANRLSHENGARIVDSDVVKPWLSGYDDGYGAGYVQNASADVATSALNKASDAGDNIVMPRIGGGSVMRDVMMLREKGYDVQIFYNEVSEETSIMRAASRFAQEGRYLSLDYLTQIGNKDSKSFRNFASAKLSDYYDTVERKGSSAQSSSAPVLLAGRGDSSGASREDSGRGDFGRGGSEDVSGVLRGGVQSGEELYRGGKGIPGDERIFSYAEWKSNDVAFGEQPKEIWNSNSGKPMPGKKEEKNDERKVSRKSSPVGEGAGQASGSAQRAGAERGPEQDRAERSGSGRAVEVATESQQTGRVAVVQQQTGQETISLGSGAVVTSGQDVQPQKLHKNRRNNVGERGKDYAPLSPKARFNANVKAIRLMRELMERIPDGEASGTVATKEEMAVLRQYSGWGGLGTYFNDESSAENRMLRDLLTEDEYQDAVMSINSAYYTPATVVDTLWDVAKALGFTGGRVLEGSAGIGNIIGQMPREMSRRSDIEAVEIDTISGNILKLLYPDAKVHIQGFQDTVIPNGSVDLAITNVPFVTGLHVIDKVDKDLSRRFTNIHDFCIAKNIRKLREGGLGIFITSSGTMDKSNDLRAWIADEGKADVIGAFRLNNETFGGTKVTSDIIVVRKRRSGDSVATDGTAIDVSKASPMRVGVWTDKYGDEHQVSMVVNDYFKEHPEMMAGEMAFGYEKGDTFRPGSYGLYPAEGKEQGKMLAGFVKRMKEVGAATVSQQSGQAVEADAERNQLTAVKEGRMLVDEKGRLCVSRLGEAVPLGLNEQKVKGYSKQQCFEDYQAVQKAVDDVLQQQLGDPDDSKLEPKLKALNAAFDKFVKRYGTLHKNTSLAFLRNDIDFPSFLALENYSETKDINGKVTVQTSKAPLFSQRVLGFKTEPQPKTVKDAVIASIFRSGGIDVDWIAEKLNAAGTGPWTADDVRKGILVSRLGFEDPSTGELVVRYKYLSGNVREKLAIAEAYNGGDGIATDGTGVAGGGTGRYAGNVEELKKVVPMDIPAHLIDFSLGSSWIPMEVYQDYLKENYDLENVRLTHVEGSWVIGDGYGFRKEKNRAAGVYSEKFRETIYGHQLVAAALNNRPVKVAKQVSEGYGSSKTTRTVVDQAATQACAVRVDEIKDEFKTWAKKKMQDDPELAQRIEKIYNEKFNALVPMEIGDEFLPDVFDGANMNIHLYGHQKRGVMRGVTAPTMLAHEVGTGKSFTLITTAMEMRRLGTAKKPMIVVQNATVAQMTADAKLLYPNAKVLSLSEKDRDAEGRRAFYAKIKYNDWDIIIVPQSTFERIPDSPERELQFIQEKIDEKKHVIEAAMQSNMDSREIQRLKKDLERLEQEYGDTFLNSDPANGGGRNTTTNKTKKKDAKREAASLDKAETRAKEQLDRAVDDVQYFDDLGVDALLVDEAHEYKHLGFQTSIGRGIKGIDPSYSKKCAGLYNKTRSVFERAGWKNVVFATGTPISNTAAEIWTFMKYLMPADVMKQNDIYYFDDFVHNFGSISQMLEFSTSGKFKENTRFAAYVNKPELIRIWSQVADTVLTKEVGKVQEKIPEMEGGKDQDVFLPQSPSLIRIMAAVRAELERFEKMDGKEKKENSSIPLTMYGIAKRAAIDPRLVDADAPDEPTSKTNAAVKEIVKDLEATKAYRGTVAVFCDNQNRLGRNGNAAKATVEFNIYDDMRDKLIKAGVPAEQIAIVKSGMSIVAKQKIFDAVNAGSIRVVLGSTQTLGTGVNMQERLHLLIHMDAPDRPMDYTQRNGRIKRQGNLHKAWGKTIRVVRFGVEDSLDVTAYQRLKTKSGFIDSIMDGKSALANNQVDRTVEEEEEGLFDNPVAVLSGSQYALKKNQAERELRRYEGKKAQWEADQVYVANALRRNKGVVADAERQIGEEQQMLEHIRSLFPDGKVNTITIQGEQVDAGNTEQLAKVMKEKVNDPVNAIVKRNRENAFYNDEVIPVTIEVDGHAINFEVSVERESVYDGGKMRTVIHKYVTYKSADLREERLMKSSSSVKDLLDEILDEVVTGRDYQERIEFLQQKIARVNGESEQLQQRVGMEFQFGKELEEAKKRVEEYTQLMKQEMAEKEAKYAAESGGRDDIATYMTEEEDSELYRADEDEEMLNSDDESMSSEELLLSLSEKEGDERNETINELVRRVRSGAARIVRMGQEVRSDGSSDAEIAGTIVGGWELGLSSQSDGEIRSMVQGRSEMAGRPGSQVEDSSSDTEVPIISWARATGHYYDEEEVKRASLDKDVWLSGAESNVYRTADGKKVIKFFYPSNSFDDALLKSIDGFSLHNASGFVPLNVLGYSQNKNGHLLIVVEQDYVDGVTIDDVFEDDGPARVNAYIDKYLENVLGMEKGGRDENGNPFHKKDGLIYKDIHGANVLMDRQGTLHIIDGYVSREGDDQKERGAGFSIEDADGDMLREVEQFADGERFDIHTTYGYGNDVLSRGRTFSTDLMPDEYGSVGELVDALRRQYPAYYVSLDGDAVRFERWASVFDAATMSRHRRTRKGTENYLRRKTNNAVGAVWSLAQRMGLDVEVLTSVEGLEGKRARSKGWFNPKTGKITIVLPNHSNQGDVINTLLHEGVAHYGLRKLFGPYFDTFLDNVYNNVDAQVRARIDAAVKKNGWSRHVATEEYLARLAERTDFEHASEYGWWRKIKQFFLKMLADAGLVMSTPLSDNDLRYVLWRSYDNLLHPDSRRSLFDKAREVQMKGKLSVRREVLADASVQGRAAMPSQQTERGADSGTEVADVNNRLLLERMHRDLKKKYPGALIVFKMPDGSLKAVGADIDAVASAFGRGAWGNDSETEYNVPEARIDWLLPRLVRMGYRIGITDAPTGDVAREGEDVRWYDEASGLLFRADEDREDVNTISVTVNEYNKSLLKPEKHVSWARQLFSREWRKYNGGRLREAWQDSMLALKRGQDIIVKYSGKPLKDYEDAYTLENLSHGRAKNEYEWFDRNLYKPLLRSFWRLQKAVGASEEDVHKYLFCKHGLERNVEMAFRDAVNKDVTAAQKKYQEDLKKWKEESKVATQSQQTGPEKPEEPKGALDIHKAYREDEDRVVNEMAWRRGLIDYQTYRETDDAIRTKYAPDYLEFRSKDYAGLTGLFATEHVESDGLKVTDYPPIEDAEAAALAVVEGMEGRPLRAATVSQHRGTNATAKGLCDDLWEKINGCTKWTLLKSYQSGQMSKAMYEHVRDMFEHYIPLRGWDGTNAQDVYDYVGGRAGVFSKSVIPAKGRTSVADNPIAYIGNMAMSGIVIGQKNMVKQRLLNLARNHKSDLLSVHGAWYQNVGSDEDPLWQSVTADIPDDASAQEVADIIDAFERRMEALKKDGKATQDRAHLNIVYPAPSQQLKEHEVHVMENGKEYVIYVNGDPRLAQAVNGTRQRKAQEGHTGFINQLAAKSGRFKAAIYTSFSPAFIVTNWTRDITMAIASSLIDHGVMYNARAARNTAALLNPLNKNNIFRLMWLYTHDQLDMRSSTQRMFKEFMAEGAETGFIAQLDLESFKNGINKELGRANQSIADPRRVFRGYLQLTEFLNRCIEDSNRFVVYRTSRERGGDGIATNGTRGQSGAIGTGMSAMRAAAAAKDVTLNFNRKGSGELGNAFARGAFIFVNPAIQGIQTLFRLAKGHPFKFTGVTAGWVLAGAMMPYVNAMLVQLLGGDDGDDDAYWQLPEHVRRQCLCLYVGDGDFLTIPLAQEFRTFWGIGEQAAARTMGHGKESVTEEGMDIVESFLDLLPLDLMGHGVRDAKWASHDWWVGMGLNFTPDLIKTELESLANRDFTGKPVYRSNEWNKHLPEWTKSFKGTPEWITKSTELLNTLTGGEGTWKSGWADVNPSVIDHELRGWVGGPFNFGAGIVSTAVKLFNGDDVKVYDVPVLNRLLNSPSERETKDGLPQSYWKMYIEEWKPLQQTLSEMKKQALAGNNDAFRALEEFYRGDEYQRYADMERQVEAADALRKSAGNGDSFEASEAAKKETPAERYKALRTGKDVFEDWCVDAIGDRTLSVQKEAEALRQSRNRQDGDADAYRREHALELEARRAVEQYRKLANFHKQRLGHGGDDADAKAMGAIRRERDKVLRRYLFEDIFND